MKVKYKDLLLAIQRSNWKVVPVAEYCVAPDSARILAIQHDIDANIEKAKQMALMEHEYEIYSSYFIMNTNADYIQNFNQHCNYICQLGHEIGLHLDILSASIQLSVQTHEYIMASIIQLHQCGIRIQGVSHHHNEIDHKMNFHGWEYFYDCSEKEFTIEMRIPLKESHYLLMGVHPLKEYGLRYAAEKIPRDNFIHNAKGELRINRSLQEAPNRDEDIFEFLNSSTGRTILSLNHEHWDLT